MTSRPPRCGCIARSIVAGHVHGPGCHHDDDEDDDDDEEDDEDDGEVDHQDDDDCERCGECGFHLTADEYDAYINGEGCPKC